jgi:hypothetical protein
MKTQLDSFWQLTQSPLTSVLTVVPTVEAVSSFGAGESVAARYSSQNWIAPWCSLKNMQV